VLVLAPHPDDEAIGCAGTILRHVAAGDEVCVCIATDGRRSRALPDPDRMAERRRREASAAAGLLGVERLSWLGLAEGECSSEEVARSVLELLRQIRPDLIYAPSRIDFHPEHFKVAHALAVALTRCDPQAAPAVRIYPVQVPLGAACNLVSELPGLWSRIEQVLSAYSSQSGVFRGIVRRRRYAELFHRLGHPVEEFWQLAARDYIALHRQQPDEWRKAFRGMRNISVSDPLAYLAGRAERRRLKALAGC
jgi:LmbE family N-acetylglucosaminyl deacetylase